MLVATSKPLDMKKLEQEVLVKRVNSISQLQQKIYVVLQKHEHVNAPLRFFPGAWKGLSQVWGPKG